MCRFVLGGVAAGNLNMTRFSLLIMAILAVGMGYPAGAGTHVLPSLATDQADYSPGSRASVSGTGFRPGETIRLQVLQINTADNKGPEHQPWKIKADPTGGFKDIWPVATHEAGATLRLTAAGLRSCEKIRVRKQHRAILVNLES